MNIVTAHNLVCPIDGVRLQASDRQLVCANGHTYDIARQGYVNLLPVQHKRSKQPGDSKAMVLARRQFLDIGLYEPIARKLTEIVIRQIAEKKDICFLDAGCGEGYYFDTLFDALKDNEGTSNLSFIGLDISKDAIIQSAKRNKQIRWLVGTNRQPPVEDKSIDIIICLFGFISVEGFSRVLKPGGKIILLDPGPEHLKELRSIIYPEVKKTTHGESPQIEGSGFFTIDEERLQFKIKITANKTINDLLIMTPHFYRATKAGREAAASLDELELTVDVTFSVLEKLQP